MSYKIVRLVGGSWKPVSKKRFSTHKKASNYYDKLSHRGRRLYIIETSRLYKKKKR